MQEFLGVFVEPTELESRVRHDRIREALYGYDEKCIISNQGLEDYGVDRFDTVDTDDFKGYWESADADRMFVAGELDTTVELISGMDVSSEELCLENYTVRGTVEIPGWADVFFDEVRSRVPFHRRHNLVEENTASEALEEMEVPDAEVERLENIARPPGDSKYYSNTSV